MKSLKFTLAAVALALTATPAMAQDIGSGPDSQQFVDAVQKRDGDKATQLIAAHPTIINARDSKGDTALIIAIKRSDQDWTGFLLNKNADPNASGAAGDTPLIAAARVGFDEAAGWLLDIGAKVDEDNKMGETPLIVAVQQRDTRLVKLLLDHGANPDKADSAAGYSARDYAKRDPRAREILMMIDNKKPNGASASAK
jgi:uncharacterized protein